MAPVQIVQADELNLEIRSTVAVHVALDEGPVVGLARQVLGLEVQLAGDVVKILRADEPEGLIAATNFGVDGDEVDVVVRMEVGNDVPGRTVPAVRQGTISEVVAAGAAGQAVLACPPEDSVDIVASVDNVLAGVAEEKVLTACAGDRVAPDAPEDDILQVVARHDVVACSPSA